MQECAAELVGARVADDDDVGALRAPCRDGRVDVVEVAGERRVDVRLRLVAIRDRQGAVGLEHTRHHDVGEAGVRCRRR